MKRQQSRTKERFKVSAEKSQSHIGILEMDRQGTNVTLLYWKWIGKVGANVTFVFLVWCVVDGRK